MVNSTPCKNILMLSPLLAVLTLSSTGCGGGGGKALPGLNATDLSFWWIELVPLSAAGHTDSGRVDGGEPDVTPVDN